MPTAQEMEAAHQAEIKREQSIVSAWIMTPIRFYGKVVDQNGNPVSDAKIVVSPAQHPFGKDPEYERRSDADGLFSIDGTHGAVLQVTVLKEGYYSLPESWGDFTYAGPSSGNEKPAHPDPNDPAIFVLRKMGQTEPLIVFHNRQVIASKTGEPVTVDLKSGAKNAASDFNVQVQTWVNETPGRHFDWRYAVSVPNGGLQPRTGGEFQFEAPTDGYSPSDEVATSGTAIPWTSEASGDYFVTFNNGEYARISFKLYAGGGNFFDLTSYLNPVPGHRNLEYNPNQAPAAGPALFVGHRWQDQKDLERKTEAIFIGEFLSLGSPTLDFPARIDYHAAPVQIDQILKGSLSGTVKVSYFVETVGEKEANPEVAAKYIFFVKITGSGRLYAVKLLPLNPENLNVIEGIITSQASQ
jgi:hypothetical protein